MDRFIEEATGKGLAGRPNKLEKIQRTTNGLKALVDTLKARAPEDFQDPDPKTDVNP